MFIGTVLEVILYMRAMYKYTLTFNKKEKNSFQY